ncbi:MAG: hypothetical protein R3224_04645, partial [Balneolaceae bacterium]|nr:hypothetical protein [Balneolaceae bacterium]
MSLLHQNRSFSTGDYLFIAAGLLGLFGFFMVYGSQDPRSMIDTTLNKQSATLKAAEVANTLGYDTGDYRTEAGYGMDRALLDSLQAHLGRPETIDRFSTSPPSGLFPYFWEVRFSKMITASDEMEITLGQGPEHQRFDPGEFTLQLAPDGRWIGLINEAELMPDQPLHREALRYAIRSDSLWQQWSIQPDSIWKSQLSFEREGVYETKASDRAGVRNIDSDSRHRFTRQEVLRLAAYHLGQAGWDLERFQVSEIRVEPAQSTAIARIRYTKTEPVFGQSVALQTAVLPSGALMELEATYNATGSLEDEFPSLWALSGGVAIFLFVIGSIVIFYLRIRARVVDTRSALVVSILAGFVIPASIFLSRADDIQLFGEGSTWLDLLGLGLQMGISGAFAAVGFFVVSAISDSVTRQYWPVKLDSYDYLRQGMIFNKPVGETVVRAVVLWGMLAGFWATSLMFFPRLYLEIEMAFLSHEVAWAPLYLLLDNFWYSLIIVMGIYLVVGSQVYGRTGNRWIAGLAMILSVVLFGPLPFSVGPVSLQFLFFFILGVMLTAVFIKWDFLTL